MDFRNRNISPSDKLITALKRMDELDRKLLLVVENGKFCGLLSIGDIQRAIIRNQSLDSVVSEVLRKNIRTGKPSDSFEDIKKNMLEYRMEFCPVVTENNEIVHIYFWEDVFPNTDEKPVARFHVPVVIMAGGFGTRLRPLTHVIPKPMIPIGEKTMLEEIFDRFGKHGCDQFFLSVNYKSDLIRFYIDSKNLPCSIEYFQEPQPLGTAGSLTLLKGKLQERFFVNNCDILIEEDYSEILNYHLEQKNEITLVAAMKTYNIPYGTIETGENGQLLDLKEKPELTFKINSGMYLLEPHLLDEIPEGKFFHITDLIDLVRSRNGNVGVFPVSEKSWKDVGEWPEYLKLIQDYVYK